MDLAYSAEDRAFREATHRWLLANVPPDEPTTLPARRAWHRRLYETGYVGMGWPVEYGGRGATPLQQAIVADEMARTNAPPPIRHVIKTLVPRVDKDGNERGGVPTVQNDAPLGTYLGWNITAGPGEVGYDGRPFHQGQVCNYTGGMVPFFKTKAQRLAAGDPRKSLEERYGTHEGYVKAVAKAAHNAYAKGYLLAADRDALIAQAEASDVCNQPGDGGKCNPAP